MGISHDNKCMGPNHIRYIWTTFVYTSCKGMSCMQIYNACLYMSYIHPHIYLQGTLAHVLDLLYDQDTQELLDMLSSTPATPVTSPSEPALPSAPTSPTAKDTSQPGCGAVWGGLSLSIYYMCLFVFLEERFQHKDLYIYI